MTMAEVPSPITPPWEKEILAKNISRRASVGSPAEISPCSPKDAFMGFFCISSFALVLGLGDFGGSFITLPEMEAVN